jgi:hypothetical protein
MEWWSTPQPPGTYTSRDTHPLATMKWDGRDGYVPRETPAQTFARLWKHACEVRQAPSVRGWLMARWVVAAGRLVNKFGDATARNLAAAVRAAYRDADPDVQVEVDRLVGNVPITSISGMPTGREGRSA